MLNNRESEILSQIDILRKELSFRELISNLRWAAQQIEADGKKSNCSTEKECCLSNIAAINEAMFFIAAVQDLCAGLEEVSINQGKGEQS